VVLPSDLACAVRHLDAGVAGALGAQHVGTYLVGSWALGHGDRWSDVDFVVVTRGRVDDSARAALSELHGRLPDSGGWLAHLEGSYADVADLRSPMTLGRRWPYVDNGSRTLEDSDHDNTAHTRWVLRERGLVVSGPDPRGVVAEVTPAALRAEALGVARVLAEEVEDDPDRLDSAWFQPFAVLTACRVLVTATHARVDGKVAAARWALGVLDPAHHDVVRAAVADRPRPWGRVHERADPRWRAPTRALLWDVARMAGEETLRSRGSLPR
jgi:hypothetical protein